jgi:hypothetical protein
MVIDPDLILYGLRHVCCSHQRQEDAQTNQVVNLLHCLWLLFDA